MSSGTSTDGRRSGWAPLLWLIRCCFAVFARPERAVGAVLSCALAPADRHGLSGRAGKPGLEERTITMVNTQETLTVASTGHDSELA